MQRIGHTVNDVTAVFITHEHSDHIRGLDVFRKNHDVPIYSTKKTLERTMGNFNFIKSDDEFDIGSTKIQSFSKCHDASDPVSYVLMHDGKKVSVITDIGVACDNVIKHVKDSNVLFLESNYDDEMLNNGRYPYPLKKRISDENGHLSNYQAGLLILEHASPTLSHVFLSHLSENNNDPKVALDTFNTFLEQRKDLKIKTILTSRYDVSEVVRV
jgi:phosphoribosyl 1,2-cyclic phosphodiesterase